MKAGKLHHRTLTPGQAEIMRLAIANQRNVKKLMRVWEAQTLNLIELKTAEIASNPPSPAVITRNCVRRFAECKA
jgi:hypothetical protein